MTSALSSRAVRRPALRTVPRIRPARALATLVAVGTALAGLTGCTNLMPGAEDDAAALAAEAEAIGLADVVVDASMVESVVPYLTLEATAPPELDREALATFLVGAPEVDTEISSIDIELDDGTDVRDLGLSIDAGHEAAAVAGLLTIFEGSTATSLQIGDATSGDLAITATAPAETLDEALDGIAEWTGGDLGDGVDLDESVVHAGGISLFIATADESIRIVTDVDEIVTGLVGVAPQITHRPPRPEHEANPKGHLEIDLDPAIDDALAQEAADALAAYVRDEVGADRYRLLVVHGEETLLDLDE